MRIDHVGIYVKDIEQTKEFFVKYFDAKANDGFYNEENEFSSYLISFESGSRLEIMNKPNMVVGNKLPNSLGYDHISIGVGSREKVVELFKRLSSDGFKVIDEPDLSPDGFYESCILDINGNTLEITV